MAGVTSPFRNHGGKIHGRRPVRALCADCPTPCGPEGAVDDQPRGRASPSRTGRDRRAALPRRAELGAARLRGRIKGGSGRSPGAADVFEAGVARAREYPACSAVCHNRRVLQDGAVLPAEPPGRYYGGRLSDGQPFLFGHALGAFSAVGRLFGDLGRVRHSGLWFYERDGHVVLAVEDCAVACALCRSFRPLGRRNPPRPSRSARSPARGTS